MTPLLATMTDAEKLELVLNEVNMLEEQVARAMLRCEGLPERDLDVRRLVFARHLRLTLRLREHTA